MVHLACKDCNGLAPQYMQSDLPFMNSVDLEHPWTLIYITSSEVNWQGIACLLT